MSTGSPAAKSPGADVFISYTGADEAWATWVAAVLEAEGQRVAVQAWDSPAGTNFVVWINEQMTHAVRTVAICSQAYFGSHWCTQEWAGALAANTLTPLRVEACTIPPVLATTAYRDLHGIDEATARRRLIEAVGLARPARRSDGFPGRAAPPTMTVFPGQRAPRDTGAVSVPRGAVRIADADPYRFGVHPAIRLPEGAHDVPPAYVERDIDLAADGVRARLRTAAVRGGFLLLVGGSSVGKTRCAIEAVKAELPDWWLLRPTSATDLRALAAAPPARTVLWLDELQNYLGGEHGLTAGIVHALLDAPGPVVLVGTLWPTYYRTLTALPASGDRDAHQHERALLRLAAIVDVHDQLSPDEQDRAHHRAKLDRRLQAALDSPDHGLTQTLAAGPELVRHWSNARTDNPYAWAILTAALDAARLGARNPLPGDLLRAAAADYCTPRQQAEAPTDWFEHALAYATTALHGAASALTPTSSGTGMGHIAGYINADYLRQHAATIRRYIRPPASLWTALRDYPSHTNDLERLTGNALDYRVYALAVPLLRRGIDTGDQRAARRLADLLTQADERHQPPAPKPDDSTSAIERVHRRADSGYRYAAFEPADLPKREGEREDLRRRADAGNAQAASQLADLLIEAGAHEELRHRADSGDFMAGARLAELLARSGDREELRRRANAGNEDAARELARLLIEAGDRTDALEFLRPLADAGMGDDWGDYADDAAGRLSNLLVEAGDREEMRRRADAGDGHRARMLADLLASAGDHAGAIGVLRPHASTNSECAHRLAALFSEAGDRARAIETLRLHPESRECARRLDELLAAAGDREELRRRVESGNRHAAFQLFGLLAAADDREELRRHADAGDWAAVSHLAGLLASRGDDRLKRYGFDVHGQIADGPTW
ncbi:TIR domain-containing protein [Frankia sp. CiP3]|uniref:TIR domain-containing protein n=1 Tax=Frankia sp. CiP3 TaxID=2880971 RepID=UPI001EF73779|nr:TIR domain-containing protein [Frankia sp. CiP3]